MEKNLGFFEAWRAKRREKKNEELERLSAMRVETSVLSKYLAMRNEKTETGGGLSEIQSSSEKTNEVIVETNSRTENSSVGIKKDVPQYSRTSSTTQDSRRSSIINTPSSSARNSIDFGSRRGSLISPLSSFSTIQGKFMNLSQDQSQTESIQKKTVKVNKLSEDVLKIGKQNSKELEESIKTLPKINSNLQSRLTKFAVSSTGNGSSKTDESLTDVKKTTIVKTEKVVKSDTGQDTKVAENSSPEGKTLKEKESTISKDSAVLAVPKETTVVSQEMKTKELIGPEGKTLKEKESTVSKGSTVSAVSKNTAVVSQEIKTKELIGSERKTLKEKESTVFKDSAILAGSKETTVVSQEIKTKELIAPQGKTLKEKESTLSKDSTISAASKDTAVVSQEMKTKELVGKVQNTSTQPKLESTDLKASTSTASKEEKKSEPQASSSIPQEKIVNKEQKCQEIPGEVKNSLVKPPSEEVKADKNAKTGDSSKVKVVKKVTKKLDKDVQDVAKSESQKSLRREESSKSVSSKVTDGVKGKPETVTQPKTTGGSKNSETEVGKSEVQRKSSIGTKKTTQNMKSSLQKEATKVLEESVEISSEKSCGSGIPTVKKPSQPPKVKETTSKPQKVIQNELIKEAVKIQEGMTKLTNKLERNLSETETTDKSEASCISEESISFRKDPKKLEKKLKAKSNPNECYPKTQKLLVSKPINAFEQAKLEESKTESVVSPTKVEAFLREALSPPTISGDKEPVKTMEAVVEEILTSTSEKSKHEKPSKVRYTSRGEVICGVVSIKPSNKEEDTDSLSAITLVPAFQPEKPMLNLESDAMESEKETKTTEIFNDPPRENPRECFSPTISDFSDDSYDHYVASVDYSFDSSYSRRRSLRSSSTPRRIFPQIVKPSSYRMDRTKEDSPVVFDAGLSFDIGSHRTSLRHRFKPQPAFRDLKTTSSSLSMRISDFLKRTDHIMEEWKHLGKGGEDLQSLVQLPSSSTISSSKSATNIMIKGLLNYSKGSRTPSLRSRSLVKTSEASDRTISDIDELSEMTLDLSEERATGTIQAERLEAETAERVRLEQELSQVQSEKKNLQQTSERLEMELFYARADVNGLSESEVDLEDGGGDAALYKNKCERAMRELEFTRRRLQQQHEDDLEQLVALKKQLEKKLSDAYEEVEEQRQVAAQWKRKVQKLQSETNDLRLLLEEQSSRNNLLEKKQRKFDSEIQMLQEELRSERNQKERLSREKEMAIAEKYSLEQNLSSVRLELELKEEKVSALSRELEELSRGGGTEQEITQLRKSKHDLEMKLKEQEEELDELAGQVSMLEGNKLRLEMSLESLRKEHRREMAQRDDELDEVRANSQKKIKVLESQLESEHEERTLLVREKHELERRLADAEERGRHHRAADEDALQRARRDLKKTKALLRDAQVMLERAKQDSPSKAALRALKNQLEDAELARASAVKAKQSLEAELSEVSGQLEEALRAKGDAENRCQAAVREMNSLRTQVDENEEELAELLKKYRQTVQQLSAEQLANQETAGALAEAEAERASLRDQLAELTARLEANTVVDPISGLAQKKLEIRIKELESRLELEQTTRGRLEVQISRLKENVERLNEECVQARTKEQVATDLTRKLQRSLREAKEDLAAQQAKEQEAIHKRKELEKRLDTAESEAATARTDLRLAVKRIEDLQSAISGEIGSDSERSDTEEEDSENDSLVSHVPSTLSSTSRTSRTPELTPR